ncbi:MAG TPA: hypothetical protein VGL56_13445 [Fimbriimonadaceae bacterium]
MNDEGTPTGTSESTPNNQILNNYVDTFMSTKSPAGLYEVEVVIGSTTYKAGYIEYTAGC